MPAKKPQSKAASKSKSSIGSAESSKSAKASKSARPATKTAPAKTSGKGLGASLSAAPPYSSTVYQVQPSYTDPASGVSTAPFFLPPTSLDGGKNNIYGKSILVTVPNVYGTKAPSGCTLDTPTDFTLTWGTDASKNPLVQVTIPAYAWNVSSSDRQKLQTSFAGLCSGLESLEDNQCLARGGAFAVAQRVVEAMPMPITEILYYKYGFDQPNACIDIQPGMRIRIESQGFEMVASNSPLNGFVESSIASYAVCTRLDETGSQVLAFDAFLGAARPSILQSSVSPAGGIIDLQTSGNSRRYFRLFYPATISNSSTGNTSLANNVALIGADSLSDLTSATTKYLQDGGCAFDGTNSVFCVLFRGRAIVVPEIQVFLGAPPQVYVSTGQPPTSVYRPLIVPVGTTLRNLVQGQLNWIFTPTTLNTTLSVLRQYHQLNTTAPTPSPANYSNVQLNPASSPPSGLDVFDLPLVKGDAITFSTSISN